MSMFRSLDFILVASIFLIAALYAFASLAPREWRRRLLAALGSLVARLPGGARIGSRLLMAAAAGKAGCGGCQGCGPARAVKRSPEARVPLTDLRSRR
ncbi:MAG: DUF6587 family protein [Steroidobacteraceae bacterium]